MSLSLKLTPLGEASSWGSLLRAYELWALDDDDIHQRFCAQLLRELPDGLDGRPQPPDQLYLVVRDLAEGQIECLDDMMKQQAASQRPRRRRCASSGQTPCLPRWTRNSRGWNRR